MQARLTCDSSVRPCGWHGRELAGLSAVAVMIGLRSSAIVADEAEVLLSEAKVIHLVFEFETEDAQETL